MIVNFRLYDFYHFDVYELWIEPKELKADRSVGHGHCLGIQVCGEIINGLSLVRRKLKKIVSHFQGILDSLLINLD